ncbi:MAG TPA: hypothetical protein VL026_03070, partial [Rhizomicrobium sp.]|nr:hypothetical protein [Rhizomicrobium sp.]
MIARPTDVLVTGFTKSAALMEKCLTPLLELRQENVVRDIHYVTWDAPDLDPLLAPLAQFSDIKLTRVPQPKVSGTSNQKGLVYQVRGLEAALDQVVDDDVLVLKTRPDFVIDADFLRDKIENFEAYCTVPQRETALGVLMPKPIFDHKIWLPWADCNQPFFWEDGAFMGLKTDVEHLVTPLSDQDMKIAGNPACGFYPHVVRYARIFCKRYPIFQSYIRHYDLLINDLEYREGLVGKGLTDHFFWHLVVANAWILYSQFHIDCGIPGELQFYPNNANKTADWSDFSTLNVTPPYDQIDGWRIGTKPGRAMDAAYRVFARLMDDAWQTALFTKDMPDMEPRVLRAIMHNVAHSPNGRLKAMEMAYYRKLTAYRDAFVRQT